MYFLTSNKQIISQRLQFYLKQHSFSRWKYIPLNMCCADTFCCGSNDWWYRGVVIDIDKNLAKTLIQHNKQSKPNSISGITSIMFAPT
jgi:hypothetical protein